MCVAAVNDWDRHGAPAGDWAQASVSHLAFGDRCVAAGSVAASEVLPKSVLNRKKGPERLDCFFKIIFAVLVDRGWLETGNIVIENCALTHDDLHRDRDSSF